MPGGDRTGPRGMGPMTGRMAGYCAGTGAPGYANPVPGRGMGWGRGGGWGRGNRWRNQYYATGMPGWARAGYAPVEAYGPPAAPPTTEQEAGYWKQQAAWLQQQLEAIGRRIEELEKE